MQMSLMKMPEGHSAVFSPIMTVLASTTSVDRSTVATTTATAKKNEVEGESFMMSCKRRSGPKDCTYRDERIFGL